ncbi:extracellular solute-binding protein [Paenibacillus favisporus]|uniref:extracellular solute-binding protein n=1 Tax=Paenibacillus favisporus TaxID=221028 RepID=UPI003D2E7D9A
MSKKNWLSILICVITITSVITACSKGENAAPPDSPNEKAGEGKNVTYQFLRNSSTPEYPSDGGEGRQEILKGLEKAGITGFDYKLSLASGDDYNTKLNLLATSGELPDYFDIDSKTLSRFVEQGLVQPIDEYLKKAPHLMKAIPEQYWKQVTFDGRIYAIPNGTRPEPFNFPTVGGLDVRQDWLDALGLQQPTTLDELHDVLKAFVTQDPDKDGKKDTAGLGASKTTDFGAIFGAFGIIPAYWTEVDGQIKKGLVLPEMKEALAVLQQWYKEGLIDKDFPIMESKQMDEKITNSEIGLWFGDGYYVDKSGSSVAESIFKANPNAKIEMLSAPKGPSGNQGYPEVNGLSSAPLRALSAKAQDPAKLFQFLDWIANDEAGGGFNLLLYGVEGKDFTYDQGTNSIKQITPYSELYKRGYSNPIRMVFIIDRRWAAEPVRHAIEIVNQKLIKNAMWNTVQAEIDYPDLEQKLYQEYLIKIITGIWPVEKYDEFIQKYYDQGGREIEKQANELYKQLQSE